MSKRLRDYQQAAVVALVADLEARGRALLVAPTGAGKTEMICGTMDALPGAKRTLILQGRKDLVLQNARRIAGHFPSRSVVTLANTLARSVAMPGDASKADIVSATVDTAWQARRVIKAFDLLVIDEAHHSASARYRDMVEALRIRNRDMAILGATATPEREDHLGIDHLFGDEPSHVIHLRDLIGKWLVRPRILSVPMEHIERLKEQQLGSADLSAAIRVEAAEVIRTWAAHARGRKSIFFCPDVASAEDLAAAFRSAGVTAKAVSHLTPAKDLALTQRVFAEGGGPAVLTNANLLIEGFDAPALSCVGLLRAFESKGLFIQAIGRGLRLHPSKNDCIVLDYVAAHERHGDIVAGVDISSTSKVSGSGEAWGGERRVLEIGEGEVELLEVGGMSAMSRCADGGDGNKIVSRQEAAALGLTKYFDGKKCKHGHLAKRITRTGRCAECAGIWAREYIKRAGPSSPEKKRRQNELAAKYRKGRTPEDRRRIGERQKAYMQKRMEDPEYRKKSNEYAKNWQKKRRAEKARMEIAP